MKLHQVQISDGYSHQSGKVAVEFAEWCLHCGNINVYFKLLLLYCKYTELHVVWADSK